MAWLIRRLTGHFHQEADHKRRRTMALREFGEAPGPAPHIPLKDYRGQLVFKLDDGIGVEGPRRAFADGKTQRLKRLIVANKVTS